jgi:hypothetical protein
VFKLHVRLGRVCKCPRVQWKRGNGVWGQLTSWEGAQKPQIDKDKNDPVCGPASTVIKEAVTPSSVMSELPRISNKREEASKSQDLFLRLCQLVLVFLSLLELIACRSLNPPVRRVQPSCRKDIPAYLQDTVDRETRLPCLFCCRFLSGAEEAVNMHTDNTRHLIGLRILRSNS